MSADFEGNRVFVYIFVCVCISVCRCLCVSLCLRDGDEEEKQIACLPLFGLSFLIYLYFILHIVPLLSNMSSWYYFPSCNQSLSSYPSPFLIFLHFAWNCTKQHTLTQFPPTHTQLQPKPQKAYACTPLYTHAHKRLIDVYRDMSSWPTLVSPKRRWVSTTKHSPSAGHQNIVSWSACTHAHARTHMQYWQHHLYTHFRYRAWA